MSESATNSEFIVLVALWAGAVSALVSLTLVLTIFFLRLMMSAEQHRQRILVDVWRPHLLAGLTQDIELPSLPKLKQRQVLGFLVLWNYLQASVRGDARRRLNSIAHRLKLGSTSLRLLARSGLRRQLVAITTLGYLGDRMAWERLHALARSSHPLLSITAAHALVQIDAPAALGLLMPAFVQRSDWPMARVRLILLDAGPDIVTQPLLDSLPGARPEHQARAVAMFDLAYPEMTTPVLKKMLEQPDTDIRVLTVCIRALSDPRLLDVIRHLANHPDWHVRLEVAKALGRLGRQDDQKILERLLTDPEWWVRYRAAQSLVRFPFLNDEEIEHIRSRVNDRFANDMLTHALAEKGMS